MSFKKTLAMFCLFQFVVNDALAAVWSGQYKIGGNDNRTLDESHSETDNKLSLLLCPSSGDAQNGSWNMNHHRLEMNTDSQPGYADINSIFYALSEDQSSSANWNYTITNNEIIANNNTTDTSRAIDFRALLGGGTIFIQNLNGGYINVGTVAQQGTAIDFRGVNNISLSFSQGIDGSSCGVSGYIVGSNAGDIFEIDGGGISGVQFGAGQNFFTMTNTLCNGAGLNGDALVISSPNVRDNIYIAGTSSITTAAGKNAIHIPNGAQNVSININGSPSISGSINSESNNNNTLNIGTISPSSTSASFTTGGNITNIQNINIQASGTSFTVNNNITGVTNFSIASGTSTTVGGAGSISGSGSITLPSNSSLTVSSNGSISNFSSIELNSGMTTAGSISVPINIHGGSNLNVGGGTLSSITGDANQSITVTGGTTQVNGNITGVSLTLNSSPTFTVAGNISGSTTSVNSGSLILNNNFYLHQSGTITNRGTIQLGGSGDLSSNTSIDNSSGGIITLGSATIGGSGVPVLNNRSGTINRGSGSISTASIDNTSGTIGAGNGAITNSGDLDNTSGSITIGTGGMSTAALNNISGTINRGSGAISTTSINNNHGTIGAGNGAITNSGDLDNTSGSITIGTGGMSTGTLSSNSLGTITIPSGDLNIGNQTLNNAGTITTSGTGTIGATNNLTSLTNTRTITSGGGNLIVAGLLDNSAASAIFNITNNQVQVNSVNNTSGSINISNSANLLVNVDNPMNNSGTITLAGTADLSVVSGGAINNSGTMTLAGTSTIGNARAMSLLTNTGTITVNPTAVKIKANITNNLAAAALNITGNLQAGNINNTLGAVTIGSASPATGGDLSAASDGGSTLTNAAGQTITIAGIGTIGATHPLGAVTNVGTINAFGGDLKIGSLNNSAASAVINIQSGTFYPSSIDNTAGTINIGYQNTAGSMVVGGNLVANPGTINLAGIGDLSVAGSINNSGTITFAGNSTIGSNLTVSQLDNTGTMNIISGNDTINAAITNNLSTAAINITQGNLQAGNINNTLGTITIGKLSPSLGGDLSSITAGSSTLTNSGNQTINILGTGTIGVHNALGSVNNYGTINASGGNVKIGNFINDHDPSLPDTPAVFNITNGYIQTGNITNTTGNINIGFGGTAGDLSGVIDNTSTLTNSVGQTISITGTGSIGGLHPLGAVSNQGTINAGGGNINIGNFTNSHADALLNITSGVTQTGNVLNSLGTIKIGYGGTTGDLSGTVPYGNTLINNADQTILVTGTGSIGKTVPYGIITNNGTFTVDLGASIYTSGILQSGNMSIMGHVYGPITLGNNGNTINIVGGGTQGIVGGTGNDTLNVGGLVTTNSNISSIENINVTSGVFTIANTINGVSGSFNTAVGAKAIIQDNGDLSGGGSINNLGTIELTKTITGGTIGATVPMGAVYNSSTFIASGGNVQVGNFTNNLSGSQFTINSGNVGVNSLFNNFGTVIITGGDLSSTQTIRASSSSSTQVADTTNVGILKNAANHTITISNNGNIGLVNPFKSVINAGFINVEDNAIANLSNFTNNYGMTTNHPSTLLNVTGGRVMVNSINNIIGTINIGSSANYSGDLSSSSSTSLANLTNHSNQIINVTGSGTIGKNIAIGNVTNNGIINASGGNLFLSQFVNGNSNYDNPAALNINQGIVRTGNITNNYGTISIFSTTDVFGNKYSGDLSSIDPSNPSTLINGPNQIITVASGTIGANSPLGEVTNNGIINVENNINVGTFNNAIASASLNLMSGIARTGNIINSGNILFTSNATSTDLSSIDPLNPSDITNNAGATITIAGDATLGFNGALGSINNSGIINANGSSIFMHDVSNSGSNALFEITSGNIRTGNITNTTGSLLIQGGDLSSIDQTNHSNLINAPLQTITVSGNGTIGNAANCPLGAITNYGVFQAYGGNITADLFTNSKLGHATISGSLDLTSGIIRAGSIQNTFGSILINGGDLSGVTYNTATLTNAANQSITISNNGTIGANNRLGVVTNNGTINAGGGNVSFGDFTNNHAGALLNITSGIVTTGNINNTLGTIQIGNAGSSGDLSGIYDNISNLINAAGQNITVSGYGTVGVSHPLGVITNNGSITANTNKFKAKSLNNNQNAIFNLTNNNPSGTNAGIALQRIDNLGTINIYNNNTNANGITDINIAKFNNLGGGVFNVNGSLTINGNLTNNTGATTNMLANVDLVNVANNFTNNGNVSMLSSASILHGNYIVGATGTHTTMINNGAVNKLTLNNGVASLTAGATIDLNTTGSSIVRDKDQFTIISSNNAPIIADVKDINIKGGTRLISYHLSNQNNDIIITANRQSFASVFPLDNSAGTLPTILDNLINSNTQDPYLVAAISYLEQVISDQGIVNGVNQLSPDVGIAEITLATSGTLVPQIISERTEIVARSGIKELRTGYAAGGMQIDDGLWIKGLGGTIEQEERNGFAGYNANSVGVAFGADTRILPNTWIGLGLSSVGTHMKSKDYPAKKTNVSSYQVTVYGSYSPEKYYIDLYGAMAVNNYKTARTIQYINQTASATFTGIQPSAKVAIGYYLNQSNGFKIIPNVSLLSSTLYQNPYNETGASGIGLQKISSTTLSQLELGVGVKFALLDNEDSDQAYKPDLHFMVLHDLKASPQEVTAQFMGGGGSFKVTSATPDKTTYNIGAGVVFVHKNRLHFTANYEWRKKNKFIGHSGSLAVRYEL